LNCSTVSTVRATAADSSPSCVASSAIVGASNGRNSDVMNLSSIRESKIE
jgi:hypothetical protein